MATADKSKGTVALPLGDMTVNLRAPNPGQFAALRRAGQLFRSEDEATKGRGGALFLDVLDKLVVDNAILDRIYSGMADESIDLADYADLAVKVVNHFNPERGDDDHGPIKSTRRPSGARTARR